MRRPTPVLHPYYSDQFPLYGSLTYRKGYHLSLPHKHETYSVEGENADLRHYLTRLARKSCCFSQCLHWLNPHIRAFAHAWNRHQLHNRVYPFNKKQVIDFVSLRSWSLPVNHTKRFIYK